MKPLFILVTMLTVAVGVLGAARAQDRALLDTGLETSPPLEGWGESYWGPIPPPHEAEAQTFQNHSMPLWEASLVWPYRLVTFPLLALSAGVGECVIFFEDQNVIYHIQRLMAPRQLPYGFRVNLTAGGLPGFGGGVTFFHNNALGTDNTFELRVKGTVRGSHRATMGIRIPGDMPIEFGAGYRRQPNARFFGIGLDAPESAESFYTLQQNWAGLAARRSIRGPVSLEAEVLYTEVGARNPGDDFTPRLRDEFGPANLPEGFNRTSDGMSAGLSLIRSTAIETGRPDQGSLWKIKVSRFEGVGDEEAAFWNYRGEVQEFFPLWFSKRALALRGFISWIDPVGGSTVPFQRFMTNDDPDLLRGYRDFRWRDRGMVAGTAEYRWPIWAVKGTDGLGLDAYVFTDVGQVFSASEEISLRNLTTSYGFGTRVVGRNGFIARLEVGFSDEESVIRLRTDQVFQFSKGHLFHGRNPVPAR